jgi:LysR family transcriptional activator of glutamate synthase operon
MATNIDLKRLRTFLLVAKNGSLRHAATALRISVPAVSIQISQLERELGVSLFQRIGRRLVLTPTGQTFVTEAEAAIDAVDRAIESVSSRAAASARIALAMNNDLARHFSTEITRFMKRNPAMGLSLRMRGSLGTLRMVLDGEVDIGVGYFGEAPPGIARKVLGKSGFSLVCNARHPLAAIRKPSLDDIAKYRIITLPTPTNMGRRIAGVFSAANVAPMGVIEAGNCHTSREFAEKGLGVAIIHTACLGATWPKTLVRIDLSSLFGTVDIAAIHRASRRLSRPLADFLAALGS